MVLKSVLGSQENVDIERVNIFLWKHSDIAVISDVFSKANSCYFKNRIPVETMPKVYTVLCLANYIVVDEKTS